MSCKCIFLGYKPYNSMKKGGNKMSNERICGYFYVCDNETMPDDIEAYLIGLFQKHQETLGEKGHGLPHFLYHCSGQRLYGIFEALNGSGSNIELDTWRSKGSRKNEQPVSNHPVQVKVHMGEIRYPLEKNHFMSMPSNNNGVKFRSGLSESEVEDLLRIFGVSPCKRSVKTEDDNDGEWEKVKSKSKTKRQAQSVSLRRCTSPNGSSRRRRGGPHSSNSRNGVERAPALHGRNWYQFGIVRGKYHESRADAAENWRSESLYRDRPCVTSTSSLSLPSAEGVKLDKGHPQTGGGTPISRLDSVHDDSQRVYETTNMLDGHKNAEQAEYSDFAATDSSSVDCNLDAESMQKMFIKSSFESYSAALKFGMHEDIGEPCLAITHIAPNNEGNFLGSNQGAVSTDTCSSPGSVNGFPCSPLSGLHWGEILADPSQLQTESTQKHPYGSEDIRKLLSLSSTSDDQGKQQHLVGILSDDFNESVTLDSYVKNGCSVSASERFHDPDPAVNSLRGPRHREENFETSRSYHVRSEGLRLPEWSKQWSDSVPSRSQYSKPRSSRVFRQVRRVQESHRQYSEDLEFTQPRHEEAIPKHLLQSEYRENTVPHWQLGQANGGQGSIAGFAVPSSHFVHEQPLLLSPNFLHGFDDGEHESSSSSSSHAWDYSTDNISPSGTAEMQSRSQQVHWGLRSPILLYLPVFSPVVGTLPSVLPLPPPVRSGSTYIETLHADILEFAKRVRPTAAARVCVDAAVECVRDAVRELWPRADVEVFGSFSTGLCLSHSDVDVAVTLPASLHVMSTLTSSRPHAATLIRELAASLHQYPWCEKLATIETASMPLIKLQCRPFITLSEDATTFTSPVAIDITIVGRKVGFTKTSHSNSESILATPRVTHNGAAAREYVLGKLRDLPALAPLALVMKSYLHHRQLNDVYSGGLGSFSLTLLLVFYLERVSSSYGVAEKVPPFCPSNSPAFAESTSSQIEAPDDKNEFSLLRVCSSEGSGISKVREIVERAEHVVTEVLGSMESSVTPNLGTLLLGFLHTFGHSINLSCVRLVLKGTEGSTCGILPREHTTRPAALWIDDPLNPGANVGAGSFNMWHVQAAMRDMLYVLTKPNSTGNLPSTHDIRPNRHLLDELFMTERDLQGTSKT